MFPHRPKDAAMRDDQNRAVKTEGLIDCGEATRNEDVKILNALYMSAFLPSIHHAMD